MCDRRAMRLIQSVHDLNRYSECLVERQRAAFESRGECLAFKVFHDQVLDAVVMADVIQRADVGMSQPGHRACLTLKALLELTVRSKLRREDLDCDGTIETDVAGFVDLSH